MRALQARIDEVVAAIEASGMPLGRTADKPSSVAEYGFKFKPEEYNVFWDVRKGLIPIVGAAREAGAC